MRCLPLDVEQYQGKSFPKGKMSKTSFGKAHPEIVYRAAHAEKQEKKDKMVLNACNITLHSPLGLVYKAHQEEHPVVYRTQPTQQTKEEENVLNACNITYYVPPAIFAFLNNCSMLKKEDKKVFNASKITNHDPLAIVALLKDCTKQKDLLRGSGIHSHLIGTGLLENNVFIGSTLVNMYAKCGALPQAQQVFDQLRTRNIVSWNILIAGYTQHGHGMEALDCFEQMKIEGLYPNSVTFLCLLKACIIMKAADKGQEIHDEIIIEGLLEHEIVVANALIDMYAKLGMLEKAQDVFDKLPIRDVVSWNALILGYAEHGHAKEALSHFEQMQCKGFAPSAVTFLNVLKACASVGDIEKGEEIHAQIATDALFKEDVVVGTALVDMYSKCGSLVKAQEVFDKLPVRTLVSWTALITGYAQHGHGWEALDCYKQMQFAGLCPNAVTFICVLKACGSVQALDEGQEIHAQIVKEGLLESDMVVGTALVDMYANCGMLPEAQHIFDRLKVRDIISWNALIMSYAQHVHGEEALKCFEQMQAEGFAPNVVTFVCILKACANSGAAYKGQEFHAEIAKDEFLESTIIGTALVDMYANCGMLMEAQDVFDNMGGRDVVSWNTLIAGYAQLGKDEVVFSLFNKMLGEGNLPDLVTFTILLNTCSHTGQLDKAQFYFETMRRVYGITPIKEHHTCMVDLYGRAGLIDKAIAVIKSMPVSVCRMVWQILLTACCNQGNMKLGKLAFEHAAHSDERDGGVYVCMGNLYAAFGMQETILQEWILGIGREA